MSFSKSKRDSIKHYILEKISEGEKDYVEKATNTFHTSKNTIYRYLRELYSEKIIDKKENRYYLVSQNKMYTIDVTKLSSEDDDLVFSDYVSPELSGLPDNIQHIWFYCFTELMNNVIDHSMATEAKLLISKDQINTTIVLIDNGIGIFKKIKDHYHYPSLDDAIIELFKGKLTTDTVNHSGEGIFFSSRIMDVFAAISDDKIFSHTEYDEIIYDIDSEDISLRSYSSGTIIFMRLSNFSNKTTKEIMDKYADIDGGFTRTRIPLKNIYPTYPVSRSQAKRLSHRFDSFLEVELDFNGVPEIGQGFAHELFVVYAKKHPQVLLMPFNASIAVQRMIHHVLSDK